MHRLIILFGFSFLLSCSPTKRLPGGTKVLLSKYKNIDKFDQSIYTQIDPDYFYNEVESYRTGSSYKDVLDHWVGPSGRKIQFYEGGYLRILSAFRDVSPNPEVSGMRGIIYKKKHNIQVDTQYATDVGSLYKQTSKVIVEGDRIYLVHKLFGMSWGWSSNPMCEVYQKAEKVPEDWKQYKPDW